MEISNDTQNSQAQILEHKEKVQLSSTSLWSVNETIELLLRSTFSQIRQKQLLHQVPNFLQSDFMNILNQYIYQSTPNFGTLKPSRLDEEDVTRIIKIEKDNLSPKQLPSQNPQNSQVVKEFPQILSAAGSRKLNMTNRSSFKKRKKSQVNQLPSGAVTQRTNLQTNLSFESSKASPQKTTKSISTKKDPLLNFTSILSLENQDPEIIHLREKVHFNLKQKEKQQMIFNERLNEDQEKINNFNAQFGKKGNYTFDFDGGAMGSETLNDEKINCYAMKVGVKTFNKKYRTIYKHLLNTNNSSDKNQQSIIRNKNQRVRQSVFDSLNLQKSTCEMPNFERQQKTFALQSDPSKLKILEYKRLYGKRFSRYDNNPLTIDISTFVDKKLTEDDLFSSKRHLTDSLSINKSRSSSMNKEYATKKLALPKLQGKYKVLDRYQSIDLN